MPTSDHSSSISAGDLLLGVRRNWLAVLAIMLGCVATAAVAGALMPRTYRAEVVVVPVVEEGPASSLASLAGQFGGLASLAGVNLRGSTDTAASIAALNSRSLLAAFIEDGGLLPVLFADDWDARAGRWKQEAADDPPTTNDGIELLDRRVREVFEDKDSGLVTVSVEWRDPQQAADWANSLVDITNARLRQQAIVDARRNVEYLRQELEKTEVVSVRDIINRLMESDIQRIALANANPEYAFKVIDPARPPDSDDYVSPNWPMLLVAGLLLGAALALLLVVWRGAKGDGSP
jgi:uncharacterized protein involved in exopolysaccharide biosynthesis